MKKNPVLPLAIILCVATTLMTVLAVAGIFARPIADDLPYIQTAQNSPGLVETIAHHYSSHNGRLSQATVVFSLYAIFDESVTRVAPLLLLAILSASTSLLIFVLSSGNLKGRVLTSVTLGTLMAGSILIAMPSLFDTLYWLTSSTVYVTSLAGVFLVISLVISVYRHKIWDRRRRLLVLPVLLIPLQSFGEFGAILSIAIAGLALAASFFYKKKPVLLQSVLIFISLIAGFLVNLLSPSTVDRRDKSSGSESLNELVINTLEPLKDLLGYIEWWHIVLAIFVAAATSIAIKIPDRYLQPKNYAIYIGLSVTLLFSALLLMFTASAYSTGSYFALRNFTIPQAVLFISLVFIFFITLECVGARYARLKSHHLTAAILVLSPLLFMPPVIYKATTHIQAMAVRDSLYSQREESIKRQKTELDEGDGVYIEPVPIMLQPSQAIDLMPADETQVWWMRSAIEGYYSIPDFKVYDPMSQRCLSSSNYIPPSYACSTP